MHQYGVRDIEKLLGLPRSTIRALIGAGFVTPARGPRNAWLFSFQDLIVLRTAQALSASLVPNRRITKSLKELRRNLPEEMPLSGLRIAAVGDRVVVKEGDTRWQAEGGQYLLAFAGDPAAGSLNVVEHMPSRPKPRHRAERAPDADDALEHNDTNAAIDAYRRAIAAEPARLDARTNLGRLACARHDQPYIVPIHFDFDADGDSIYSFSTLGQKIDWMRANPKVCLEVDDIADKSNWTTVVCTLLFLSDAAVSV